MSPSGPESSEAPSEKDVEQEIRFPWHVLRVLAQHSERKPDVRTNSPDVYPEHPLFWMKLRGTQINRLAYRNGRAHYTPLREATLHREPCVRSAPALDFSQVETIA